MKLRNLCGMAILAMSFTACTETQRNQGVIKVDIPKSDTMLNVDTLMVDTAKNASGPEATTTDTSSTAVPVPVP